MSDRCANCDKAITQSTTFRDPNERVKPFTVTWVNFINKTDFSEMCNSCADGPIARAYETIDKELSDLRESIEGRISDFPMFTGSWLPQHADLKLKNLITANVTVGTGIFSEFSQGFSDFFGAVNVSTGMSFKVNKGESAARAILVTKALSLGGNCVLGVDIDYGTTSNNAATINMQGTAAVIENLDSILHADELARAQELMQDFERAAELRRWRSGQIPQG
jgi:uncharacterized protein YbjQ (UPF0145 family)